MLILASIHMEGKTLVWYQDMAESVSFSSWELFSKVLQNRFGPSYHDPVEAQLGEKNNLVLRSIRGSLRQFPID